MGKVYYRVDCIWGKSSEPERVERINVELDEGNIGGDRPVYLELMRALSKLGIKADDFNFVPTTKEGVVSCTHCDNDAETNIVSSYDYVKQAKELNIPRPGLLAFVCEDCADKIIGVLRLKGSSD